MALGRDYNELNTIFDCVYGSGGVIFPFVVPDPVDLDSASDEGLTDYSMPFKVRLLSVEVFNVPDAAGATKGGTTSVDPIIGVAVGSSGAASAGDASEILTITCTISGTDGKWTGSTTALTISTSESIWAYVKTAAAAGSYPSANQDGFGRIVLWFAQLNSP